MKTQRTRRPLAVPILALTLVAPAFADDLEDAQAAFAAGDYQEARLLVRPLLMEGNAEAQYLYGRMLEEGAGVPRDVEQAKEYYRKAAAQGHAEAKARLEALTGAEAQVEGESVAVDWFREAAEGGDPEAQFNYAHALETGWGTARDEAAARRWFERAAEAGHDGAQLRLGLMLVVGAGGPADPAAGVRWIRRAARNGNAVAEALVQDVLDARGPLDDASVRLIARLREAVWDGDEAALERLQSLLVEAAEAPPPAKGQVAGADAASAGPARPEPVPKVKPAVRPPDNVFQIRTDDPVRLRDLVEVYQRAAEAGEMEAQFALAVLYLQGRGLPKDHRRGMRWMQRAAEQGYVPAQSYLYLASDEFGALPLHGSILLDWAKERALAWDPQAFYLLGRVFETGRGVTADAAQARRWYQLAELMGVEAARRTVTVAASAPAPTKTMAGKTAADERPGVGAWMTEHLPIVLASVLFLSGIGLLAWWLYQRRSQRFQAPPLRRDRHLPGPQGRVAEEDLAFVRDLWGQEGGGEIIDVTPPAKADPEPTPESKPTPSPEAAPTGPSPATDDGQRQVAPVAPAKTAPARAQAPSDEAPARSGRQPSTEPPAAPAKPADDERGPVTRLPSDAFIPLSTADIEAQNIARERRMRQRIDADTLLEELRPPAARRPEPETPPAAPPEPPVAEDPPAGTTEGADEPPGDGADARSLADVQFNIGLMFANGDGVPKNPALAAKWFEKAARQGHADAQFRLGGLYWTGELGEKDVARALEWLQQAADNGHRRARELLAKIHGQRDQNRGGAA